MQGADILEVISDGLRVQAQMAVELSRLWEEQHREQKKDAAAVKKNLAGLRETHQRLSQQISGLYESFALGEIGKPEYLAAKTAAAKQRDDKGIGGRAGKHGRGWQLAERICFYIRKVSGCEGNHQ